jgi:hypothetical protein
MGDGWVKLDFLGACAAQLNRSTWISRPAADHQGRVSDQLERFSLLTTVDGCGVAMWA